MKQKTMTVLFYLNKAKTNQKGVCPIYCRITFLKKRKQFSTGQFINPVHWNSKTQRASIKEVNSNFINGVLSIIRQNINNAYLRLQLEHAGSKKERGSSIQSRRKSYCRILFSSRSFKRNRNFKNLYK